MQSFLPLRLVLPTLWMNADAFYLVQSDCRPQRADPGAHEVAKAAGTALGYWEHPKLRREHVEVPLQERGAKFSRRDGIASGMTCPSESAQMMT